MQTGTKILTSIFFMVAATSASAQTGIKPSDSDLRQPLKVERGATKLKNKAGANDPRVLRLGPSTTYLRQGIYVGEVLRLLGKPTAVSERRDGAVHLATYIFPRSEGRILVAEFENGFLVRSSTESSESFARTKG